MPTLFDALRVSAEQLGEELTAMRRFLHQNPELSWQETETAAYIRNNLSNKGLQPGKLLAKTGFYVEIEGTGDVPPQAASPQPLIAYRADMDALAIQDTKTTVYRSQREGVGHMCGHDVHSTIAFGVACLLNQHKDKFHGKVRVFWQPAEETTPSGAPEMITEGILEGVEAVYGMHVDPHMSSGNVAMRYGADTASFDAFEITVKAPTTTHSARPHTGKDTIWIANILVQQLYQLSTRLTDSRSPLVISVSMFHGGEALNVIPDTVTFGGTIRASGETERLRIREHVQKLIEQTADLHGVVIDLNLMYGAPPVINDEGLVTFVREQLTDTIGADRLEEREQSMGAEDFGYYTLEVPAVFTRIGSSCSVETSFPLHARNFDVDESIIAPTSALQAFLLMQHLNMQPLKQNK